MQDVALKLHGQVIRCRAAVDAQDWNAHARGLRHAVDDVARLVGHGFESGADDMRLSRAACQADHQAARIHVPVRRAQAGERRHEIDAAGVWHAGGQGFAFRRAVDDLQLVPQPLHRGAGHENAALQGVAGAPAEAPGDGGQQALVDRAGIVAVVHQHERPGSVGILDHAGSEASLPEEGALLIADDAADGQRGAVEAGRGSGAEIAAGIPYLRQQARRNVQGAQNVIVPVAGVDVV